MTSDHGLGPFAEAGEGDSWPVFVKPTGTHWVGTVYGASSKYNPTPQSLKSLVAAWLSAYTVMTRPDIEDLAMRAVVTANREDLNVLGATFVTGARHLGLTFSSLFRANVTAGDPEPIYVIYADLRDDSTARARRALENNLGLYQVYDVRGDAHLGSPLKALLAGLKASYRTALDACIDFERSDPARDHVIHVPDTSSDACAHLAALLPCRTSGSVASAQKLEAIWRTS